MLREDLGFTGTKIACGEGHCGACTVQLDGVPTLSCITLVHTVGDREVTTIEGLRDHPLVHAFVRTDAVQCGFCTPGQVVSAAALVESNPSPSQRRDPARDVRQHLPLRDLSEDRGGHQNVARLIRTEKEVEGRYEDVWIVVDEDALDQWPAGPLKTVGQKVPRVDGLMRVRGEAPYTADLQLPAMLHTAVLRSPYARARVTSIDLEPARSAPGVRAVIGPADLDQLTDEPAYVGHAIAAVAADTFGQAQAAVERIAIEWDVLEPLLDPDEAVRQESFVSDVAKYERGDFERGLAEADVVVEAEYRTQVVLHNSMETHQAVCHWEDDGITIYISTQYIWGIRASMAAAARPSARQGARHLSRDGRRLRSEEQSRRLHADCGRAREEDRSAGQVRAHAA